MRWIDTTPGRLWIALLTGFGYGLFYLYAIGDLTFHGPPAWGAHLVDSPLQRVWAARSTLMFEAIAVIEMGWMVWLASPLNLFIAGVLSGLLAANLHGIMYIRAHPTTCGRARGGLLGAVPALLAGGACCAPGLLLLLGIPALGAFVGLFSWLVPLSIVLLGATRIWQHRQGAPTMFRPAAGEQERSA